MPAEQRGQTYKLGSGRWGIRWYDAAGARKRKSGFSSRSEAFAHYRDVVRPQLLGLPAADPDMTFEELCERLLASYALRREASSSATLRDWLVRPRKAFGGIKLRELERMSSDLTDFVEALPTSYLRYTAMRAMRQVCGYGVERQKMMQNPAAGAGSYPQPRRSSPIRVYTPDELAVLAEELGPKWGAAITFAASTGLRPSEWLRAERADVDREGFVLRVRGTKTEASRREVPLTDRALAAIEAVPPRLDTRLLFPGLRGGPVSARNFRNKYFAPAVEAGGIGRPARPYDLRSTFASNALAARVTTFELARIMGTSEKMIQVHYGALIQGAGDDIRRRLNALPGRSGQDWATGGGEG